MRPDAAGFRVTRTPGRDRRDVTLDADLTPRSLSPGEERERVAQAASVAHLLRPGSVAVIGAGRDPRGFGHRVLANLVADGFAGPIYPVNPHATRLCGLPVLADVADLPDAVDLAVVATPAPTVLDVARACASRGVRGLVVISAGFAETGPEGARREAELRRVVRGAGMRMVGPNCLGLINTDPAVRLNATLLPHQVAPGRVAVASQSGAVGAALVVEARRLGMGVSSFVSLGNKADVSGNDLLLYWEGDPATEVIGLYLESFGNPRKFGRIARRIGAAKPIIVINAGRSVSGSRAVGSHTAAAATPDVAVQALLRHAGVIRASTMRELLDVARLLLHQPLPRGRRVVIVGNSGGPGALAADATEAAGLTVPELSSTTRQDLRELLGSYAAVANPVDLTADGDARRYEVATRRALADPAADAVLVIYTPPFGSGPAATRAAVARAAAGADKPVMACVLGDDGDIASEGSTVPVYAFPEQAVAALALVAGYAEDRARGTAAPPVPRGTDTAAARELVAAELAAAPGGRWLDPAATARLLRCSGIEVVESVGVDGPETAAEAAAFVGFPAVLKAVGPGLVHKSDVGGVRLGLATPGEVAAAYREMAAALGKVMKGAVVQPMIRDGVEVIVGAIELDRFGPLVMFGLGGVATELLGDRVFRNAPLSYGDAAEMVRSLRCSPLLTGYRGRPPVNLAALEDLLVRVGRLVADLPEVAELDLNPVIASARAAAIVDAKVRIAPAPPSPPLREPEGTPR